MAKMPSSNAKTRNACRVLLEKSLESPQTDNITLDLGKVG